MVRSLIMLAALCLSCNFGAYARIELTVTGNIGTFEYYDSLVAEKGGKAELIEDYASIFADRPTLSLLLLVQALNAGGLDFNLTLLSSPNPERSIREVKKGNALVYQADIWEDDFDDSTYMSEPIVERGVFEKGFYVHEDSPFLNQDHYTKAQLRQLSIAVEKTWHIDIKQLEANGFNNIKKVSVAAVILDMVHRQRVDAAFMEFPSSADMSYSKDGNRYLPIPGYKVLLSRGRHFMVSKTHPDGEAVFDALNKGLIILRRQGRVKEALRQAGLYQQKVADWETFYQSIE